MREERKISQINVPSSKYLALLYATYYSQYWDRKGGRKELKDFLWPQLIIIKCDEFHNASNMDREFCCGCMCPIREGFLGALELVYSRWVAGKI